MFVRYQIDYLGKVKYISLQLLMKQNNVQISFTKASAFHIRFSHKLKCCQIICYFMSILEKFSQHWATMTSFNGNKDSKNMKEITPPA